MIAMYDGNLDEQNARGGTFDITGTTAVTNKQFWGFNADAGTVLEVIKGIPLKTSVTTLAGITSAEVDISSVMLTTVTDPLLGGTIYRADGYIITNIKLASGIIHGFKTKTQITA